MPKVKRPRQKLTRREIAKALDVHPDTVTGWHDCGLPVAVRGGRGRPSLYDEIAVRAWLAARDEEARRSAPLDLIQERAAKERAQRLLAEQALQLRAGRLLPADEVKAVWAAEVAAVRTKLLALPRAYADRIHRSSTMHGIAGVEQTLKDAVYEVLRELADPDRAPQPPVEPQGVRA
jgi:phage terminase Nu1 subunit (DNA packaging protein)